MAIPKNIFTYWSGAEMPPFVKACIQRMQDINPTWKCTTVLYRASTTGLIVIIWPAETRWSSCRPVFDGAQTI